MNKKLKISSEISNIRMIENMIDELSSELNISSDSYGKILVATLEAVNNAIIHGNKTDSQKCVGVDVKLNEDILNISIKDEGEGFDPSMIPDPTSPENIEKLHGRGVYLMSSLADKIEFNREGNMVTMEFKL